MKANPNYLHLKRRIPKDRYILLQGGTRSGKTFSTIYFILELCRKHKGITIDIVRNTHRALVDTVWKDFKEVLMNHGLYHPDKHHKTDKIYNLNGNFISYYGADDPGKIHGRKRNILWLNEANQLDEETIDQLFPRTTSRIIMDYNPSMPTEHWLDKYIDNNPPCITTYKDNPHLTKEQIREIESKQDNPYWWAVYGTGQRTKPSGVVFTNWEIGEFDESFPYIFGMDFGYVNDESTLVQTAVHKNKLYAKELLYEKGLSTDEIVRRLDGLITDRNSLIVADNAEPRLIDEIRAKGFNIVPCHKGKDSVRLGLVKMMDYKIVVDPNSRNIVKELNNYVWDDKKSNTPKSNGYDHLIDALRYSFDELVEDNQFYFD
jgi:phage terminase large subunit